MSEHFVGKVAQKAVIEKDGKVLVSLGLGDKNFDLPGGRLHAGEDPALGLARELEEELKVDVEVLEPVNIESYIKPQTGEPHLYIAYQARLRDPSVEFVIDNREIAEVRWVDREEFQKLPMWPQDKRSLEIFFKLRDK